MQIDNSKIKPIKWGQAGMKKMQKDGENGGNGKMWKVRNYKILENLGSKKKKKENIVMKK